MLVKTSAQIPSSEITDRRLYLRRREFMQAACGAVAGAVAANVLLGRPLGNGCGLPVIGRRQGSPLARRLRDRPAPH